MQVSMQIVQNEAANGIRNHQFWRVLRVFRGFSYPVY